MARDKTQDFRPDLSRLVAAPVEVDLGLVKILMSPLDDMDMAELDEWVRARYIANARKSVEDESPIGSEVWRAVMKLAMDEAMGLTWSSSPGSSLIATVDGMARLAWQGAKKNDPTLDYVMLRKVMFDPRNIFILREKFAKANAMPPQAGGKRGASKEAGNPPASREKSSTSSSRSRQGTPSRRSRD